MSMKENGLAKLAEECGEVLQVAGKMIQYPKLQTLDTAVPILHPDGTNLRDELENELGDLEAAILFVRLKLRLNGSRIDKRKGDKLELFFTWDKENNQ